MTAPSANAAVELEALEESVRALIAHDAKLREVASGGSWFEGPAWVGESLIWSDVVENQLLVWSRKGGTRTWIDPSHHQNGHTVDGEGRLLAASHGERAVVRRERDGSWRIVADLTDGKRFNSPNDLVVASDGAVWFTDPLYGLVHPSEGFGGEQEVAGTHVYRVDPRGMVGGVTQMTKQVTMPAPNGLAFSPDEGVLYVSDSERNHILGFRLGMDLDGPRLRQPWLVHETVNGTPNGIRVDPAGRIWSSSHAGVEILAPRKPGKAARHLGTLRTPERLTNLAFSPDRKTLALTGASSVYLVELGDISA